jgi:hypothetical protein
MLQDLKQRAEATPDTGVAATAQWHRPEKSWSGHAPNSYGTRRRLAYAVVVAGPLLRFCKLARFFVLLLVLPIALQRALPSALELVFGAPAHVCHCDARGGHASCACPICHPDDPELKRRVLAIEAPCGDDDNYVAPSLPPAIVPDVSLWVPGAPWIATLETRIETRVLVSMQGPEPPPPRS